MRTHENTKLFGVKMCIHDDYQVLFQQELSAHQVHNASVQESTEKLKGGRTGKKMFKF